MQEILEKHQVRKTNAQKRAFIDYLKNRLYKSGYTDNDIKIEENGKGVFKFVLQESVTIDDDNQELGIADYYKYFPKNNEESVPDHEDTTDTSADKTENSNNSVETGSGKNVWI